MFIRSILKAGLVAALIAASAVSRAQFATSPGTGIHDFVLNNVHYHIFEASGTLNVTVAGNMTVFLVAGGGGGGGTAGAGGGAGGIIAPVTVSVPVGQITVTVGGGGQGGDGYILAHPQGWPGGNSSFGTYQTAIGGGGGSDCGGVSAFSLAAANGGSGGGSGVFYNPNSPATTTGQGVPGQGYNGGTGGNWDYGAGGGGAGGVGYGSNAGTQPANGGPGASYQQYSSFVTPLGTFTYGSPAGWFGGGGGGGTTMWKNVQPAGTAGPGAGGQGGGGSGSYSNGSAASSMMGGQFTGGGGGGGGYNGSTPVSQSGGSGGSGLVIVSYPVASSTPAPVINSSTSLGGTVGTAFNYQITTSLNNATGYTASNLPPGLSINTTTGLISGTPTTSGNYTNVSVTASNAGGTSSAVTLLVTIAQGTVAPVITSLLNASGTVGTPFSYQITTSLGNATSYNAANLPPGLSVNTATGAITGTPVTAGNYTNVSLSASNSAGTSNAAALTITITAQTASTAGLATWTDNGAGGIYNTVLANRVLIGKTSSVTGTNYMLDVAGNGGIRANKVTVNSSGADFVFDPSYKLKTLTELKSYIEKNKHLPGIAPAAEMQKKGMEISENQTKLLQKVEELTLYIIEQNKKQETQKKQQWEQQKLIAEQAKMLLDMQKELEAIKNKDKQPK